MHAKDRTQNAYIPNPGLCPVR